MVFPSVYCSLCFLLCFFKYFPMREHIKIRLHINDSLDLSDLCRTLIFIETNLIYEMEFQRKPLTAVSVLTLEINSGIDV